MVWRDIDALVAEDPPSPREAEELRDALSRRAVARFYADENFPGTAADELRALGARVATAQEANLLGHPDDNHLGYARRKGLVLITCDRDYLDERRYPLIHCPAIVVFNFGGGTREEIRRSFRCLSAVLDVPQFYDKWTKIDAKRDSWTEYARHLNGTTSRSRLRLFRGRIQQWVTDP